ncbi:hypothetical protein VP416E501_P0014 [Vibrio phage 416E50-1]|nr:hypothetical protein VP416E501_P0014 [Vibrio phage 416E50-1]
MLLWGIAKLVPRWCFVEAVGKPKQPSRCHIAVYRVSFVSAPSHNAAVKALGSRD